MDNYKNFAYSQIAVAPSPQISGAQIAVKAGEGARFADAPFNAVCFPLGEQPTALNAEVIRVIAKSDDVFDIERSQESTTAKPLAEGYIIAAGVTAKMLDDISTAIESVQALIPAGTLVTTTGVQTLTNKTLTSPVINSPTGITKTNVGLGNVDNTSDLTMLAKVYPVGAIFMAVVSTNPATLFGFGTWAAFGGGRVPVGYTAADSDFNAGEKTGGSKTHTLTAAQMPAHSHSATTSVNGSHSHSGNGGLGWGAGGYNPDYGRVDANSPANFWTARLNADGSHNHSLTTSDAGSGASHNNVQPYITVFMWKRTA